MLLLVLSGCATRPSLIGPGWYRQNVSNTAWGLAESARTGRQPVDVDFEVSTPRRAEELRRQGVQLPRLAAADPRTHREFIDSRVTAVGFGLSVGGYLLYCEGLDLPVLVPESQVDLGLTSAEPVGDFIHPDRDAALVASASGPGCASYAWYRGAGGALIVPTLFSPATTPRIARTMLEVRRHLSETVQRELKVLLLGLTGTRVLQGVFSRVVQVGMEPVALAPEPTFEPATPVPAAVANAPAPGLAPSPGLVQALAGNNATRPVAPGPRLPQDVAASPRVPAVKPLKRPIGPSPTQNAQLQVDIDYLRSIGARDIRVNQQQLEVENLQRVGINRPDLQFNYGGRRYHVEYDSPASGRGAGHQLRITSNDPNAEVILLIVP